MMRKRWKRCLAAWLSAALIAGLIPFSSFADADKPAVQETTQSAAAEGRRASRSEGERQEEKPEENGKPESPKEDDAGSSKIESGGWK